MSTASLSANISVALSNEPVVRRRRGKSKSTLLLEAAIHEIVNDRAPITVRGVAYALFAPGLIDSMETRNTQKVSRIMTNMRETDDLDWRLIVDHSRMIDRPNTWENPDQIIQATVNQYRRDYWQDQPEAVEVWSEKTTVHGVLKPVLDEYGVQFRVMTGFGSHTRVREAAEDSAWLPDGKRLKVFYVGDHDPSGRFMTDVDLPKRLKRYGANCDLFRIAITEKDFHLPKFSALTKKKDPRYRWFVNQYGDDCWELDAMDPNALRNRVQQHIESCLDLTLWERAKEVEAAEVQSMREFNEMWQDLMAGIAR